MNIVTPRAMQRIDKTAIDRYGVASITLMENAGRAVAQAALDQLRRAGGGDVCLVCGKGNNGGDGFVAARHLANAGCNVDVCLVGRRAALGRDPALSALLSGRSGCSVTEIAGSDDLEMFKEGFDYPLVIDALFGTGFAGRDIPDLIKDLMIFLNSWPCTVISVDVPSGLHGAAGTVSTVAIEANITVTFGLPKKGLYLQEGPRYAGRVIVKNIGFPGGLLRKKR